MRGKELNSETFNPRALTEPLKCADILTVTKGPVREVRYLFSPDIMRTYIQVKE